MTDTQRSSNQGDLPLQHLDIQYEGDNEETFYIGQETTKDSTSIDETFYIGQEEESDDSSFETACTSNDSTSTSSSSQESYISADDDNCNLPTVIVVPDDDCEVKSINQPSDTSSPNKIRAQARSSSPTSTMTILDEDETMKNELSELSLSSNHSTSSSSFTSVLHRSVSWREEIVTDVKYRPATKSCEKRELYYNKSDMQRFKQHYKMQVRAAQEYQRRLQQNKREQSKTLKKKIVAQEEEKYSLSSSSSNNNSGNSRQSTSQLLSSSHQQQSYMSPISGLVNTLASYLAGPKSVSSSGSNSVMNNNVSARVGPVAETCVLVDTLYLF